MIDKKIAKYLHSVKVSPAATLSPGILTTIQCWNDRFLAFLRLGASGSIDKQLGVSQGTGDQT